MFLPYGKQTIEEDDVAAVVAALKSDYLTTGPEVAAFEQEFAQMVGAKYAVAACNATAALHLAMLATGIKQSDRVVTSANTFLSSANCAAFVGATPDFADIDPDTYNLCPKSLEANWKEDTKAVVAVAYGGRPANMPAIAEIARKRGAIVIEDACHSLGSRIIHNGESYTIGGHPWADITTFSFHPVKTMTTGEGGMLVTDNKCYADQARMLRSHGMVRDQDQLSEFTSTDTSDLYASGAWIYEMQMLGYNYRITDIQCALGRNQLTKLDRFIKRRQEIVDRYNEAFENLEHLKTPEKHQGNRSKEQISWHLYTVQIDFPGIQKARPQFMAELRESGVGSQVLYIPVYLQPWYKKTYGYQSGKCPNAEAFYRQALSLPLFPMMSDDDVEHVINTVIKLSSTKKN